MFATNLFARIAARKFAFLVTFFIVFTLSYGTLALFDFLPEAPTATSTVVATTTPAVATTTPYVPVTAVPVFLRIPTLDREAAVGNPTSAAVPDLDAALLKGLVRHPASAKLGEAGNILILGHSSYLPNVLNKSYQALNGVQKLVFGDLIVLQSDTTTYTYRVDRVYQSKAADVVIETEITGKKLTLVTCNSFGSKEDRFIVEATLMSEKAL
jgi:LPXTG-site transpeptidase (sortase) family protein